MPSILLLETELSIWISLLRGYSQLASVTLSTICYQPSTVSVEGKIHSLSQGIFKLNLLGWHWLVQLSRFQICNSIIHYLYVVSCAYHPKSNLLPSAFTRFPCTSASASCSRKTEQVVGLVLKPRLTNIKALALPPLSHSFKNASDVNFCWWCVFSKTSISV